LKIKNIEWNKEIELTTDEIEEDIDAEHKNN